MFKPIGSRVVVRLEKKELVSGKIILPISFADKQHVGFIEAIGNKVKVSLKIGDRIMWEKLMGQHMPKDNEDYFILNEEDILCVLET